MTILKRLRDDETGIALLTVIGVVSVMTIIALGAFALGQNVLRGASVNTEQTQAFQAANAAIDIALARIQQNGYDSTNYPLDGTDSVGATYTATLAPTSNSEYLCTATGTYRGQSETIKVKFFYLNIWNMNIASGTNNALGGGSVRGTTSVFGPFYVRGGVTLNSNSRIENGPLFIKDGDLTLTGSGSLGEAGAIDVYVTGAYPPNGSKGMNARNISQSVPDITLPLVDQAYIDGAYAQARTESVDNVRGYTDSGVANLEATGYNATTYQTMNPPNNGNGWYGNGAITARRKATGASTFYKCVGTDAGASTVGAGTNGLTIGGTGSFGAWSGDGHYTLSDTSDDFAYDDVNNVLYVHGTVFVDGPVHFVDNIRYIGNGTIVANGDITIEENLRPYTGNFESDAEHCLGLVTPNNIICNAGTSNNTAPTDPPNVMGAYFAGKDWSMSRNVVVKGSVLAGSITFSHANEHLVTDPDLPSYLPRSMPGNGQSVLTKGSWTR